MRKTKILSVLLGALLIATTAQSAFAQCCGQEEDVFPDVQIGHEYFDQIHYLNRESIFLGAEDGNFYPNTTLNRAEFATITVRLAGADPDVADYNNCFPDVTDEWFAAPICYAKEKGWVKGYGAGEAAGTYGPANEVLDIEVLTILSRFLNWPVEEGEIWYEEILDFAINANIYDEQNPILNISREKTTDIIFRTLATIPLDHATYSDELKAEVYGYSLTDLLPAEKAEEDDETVSEEDAGILDEILAEIERQKNREDHLVSENAEDLYRGAFTEEAGMPQMFPCCCNAFNPEEMEFAVIFGMQSEDGEILEKIESVEILIYDMINEKWSFALNSVADTTIMTTENLNDFADKYALTVDKMYDKAAGETSHLLHSAPHMGFLFDVKTTDGREFIVGKTGATEYQPADDFQNIADEADANQYGELDETRSCPDVDILSALQGAFTSDGVSIDTSNLDTSNFNSPMKCGESASSVIRLTADLEVLPSHEEIERRVAAGDIPDEGFKVADYLLVFHLYSYCDTTTWECEVILNYKIIKYTSAEVIGSGYRGWFDKDNLKGEFDGMLVATEIAVSAEEGENMDLH